MRNRVDLTGFAALLGDSFASRVGLLEQILHTVHYPSLGRYKERLLASAIRDFLPTAMEVGSGFVLFPHMDEEPNAGFEHYDPLNDSAYAVSRQCDILIYDAANYPVVFRDEDIVVVRPEAVRGVVEVKGALSRNGVHETLESFHDFGLKWRNTQHFYLERYQELTPRPRLILMAWDFQRDKRGRPTVTPTWIMNQIAKFYKDNVPIDDADGYPFLEKVLVHNECEISSIVDVGNLSDPNREISVGWRTFAGRFSRRTADGQFAHDKDRTIASLLATLHTRVAWDKFNRFFSYLDEVAMEVVPYRFSGFAAAYRNVSSDESRRLNSQTIYPVEESSTAGD